MIPASPVGRFAPPQFSHEKTFPFYNAKWPKKGSPDQSLICDLMLFNTDNIKIKNWYEKSLTAGQVCVSRGRCARRDQGRGLHVGLQVGLQVGLNALKTSLKCLRQLPLGFHLQGCTLEMHN